MVVVLGYTFAMINLEKLLLGTAGDILAVRAAGVVAGRCASRPTRTSRFDRLGRRFGGGRRLVAPGTSVASGGPGRLASAMRVDSGLRPMSFLCLTPSAPLASAIS